MGIVLFWIHDESPGRQRSHRLAERAAGIVASGWTLGRLHGEQRRAKVAARDDVSR